MAHEHSILLIYRLYYLGLYEASPTRILPGLFEVDYTKHGKMMPFSSCSFQLTYSLVEVIYVLGHLLAILGGAAFAAGGIICVFAVLTSIESQHLVMKLWLSFCLALTSIGALSGCCVMISAVAAFLSPMTGWHPLRRYGW